MARISYLTAIRDAMAEEMRRDPRVFVMGEDLRQNLYGTSGGLLEEFGADRVLDVPLAEAGFVGAAAGAAMVGMRPIVDVTIAPFLYPAADQLISIIAKSRYLYGGQASLPLVIRACMMYNAGTAGQHSDRPYSTFMSIPGLKIVVPGDVVNAKALLKAAIRDPDPVLFFEDVNLWVVKEDVSDDPDVLTPLGQAAIRRSGDDITFVSVAGATQVALKAAKELAAGGVSVELVDAQTVKPLDTRTIVASVRKTGRLLAIDPAHRTGSVASEVVALAAEHCLRSLKAAPMRLCTPDVHIPAAPSMEKGLYPSVEAIVASTRKMLASETGDDL